MPRDGARVSNAMAGTTRALVNNMVTGVSKGFEKKLESEYTLSQADWEKHAVFRSCGLGGDEWVSHPGAGCGVLLRQTCQDGIQVVCRPQ